MSGAPRLYATAREPRSVKHPDAVPLRPEITAPESVAAAQAQDVTLLIDDAGILMNASFLKSPVDDVRRELKTNFFRPLLATRAFVPVIERNGGAHPRHPPRNDCRSPHRPQ